MSHRLRITVRLDIDLLWARMEVHGCLTEENCEALLPIVKRSFRLLQKPVVIIDTSNAQHIDLAGIDALGRLGIVTMCEPHLEFRDDGAIQDGSQDLGRIEAEINRSTCSLIVPDILPACPSQLPHGPAHHPNAA